MPGVSGADSIGRGKFPSVEVTMAKDSDPAADDFEVTRRTLVRKILKKTGKKPYFVHEDEDILTVTEQLGALTSVHTMAVVDSQGQLVGIIPMRLLLDDLYLHVAPEEFLADLKDTESVEEFGRLSRARTAKELMEEPAFVTMDDTARDAFARLHERDLQGLPIVDAEMKVVGYLDHLQLLRLWLKQHGKTD